VIILSELFYHDYFHEIILLQINYRGKVQGRERFLKPLMGSGARAWQQQGTGANRGRGVK
jgi:hypothetical protein